MDIRKGLNLIFGIVFAWQPFQSRADLCDAHTMAMCGQTFTQEVRETRNRNDLSEQCRVTRTYIDCTLASVAGCPESVKTGIERSLNHTTRRMRKNGCEEDGSMEGATTSEPTTKEVLMTTQPTTTVEVEEYVDDEGEGEMASTNAAEVEVESTMAEKETTESQEKTLPTTSKHESEPEPEHSSIQKGDANEVPAISAADGLDSDRTNDSFYLNGCYLIVTILTGLATVLM